MTHSSCVTLPPYGKIPSVCSSTSLLYPVLWPVRLTSMGYIRELPMPSDFWGLRAGGAPTGDGRCLEEWSQLLIALVYFLLRLLSLLHPSIAGHPSCHSDPVLLGTTPSPFHPTRLRAVPSQPLQNPGPGAILCALLTPSLHLCNGPFVKHAGL